MSLSPPKQRIKAKRAKRWVVLCAGLLCFQGVYGQGIDRYADDAVQRLSAYLQIDTITRRATSLAAWPIWRGYLKKLESTMKPQNPLLGAVTLGADFWGQQRRQAEKTNVGITPSYRCCSGKWQFWSFEPLSGDVKDGFIYGRGAIDTKGLGIAQLQAFLALAASGQTLNRDVLLLATADEEAGGFYGAGWLIENRPELFADVGYVLNEALAELWRPGGGACGGDAKSSAMVTAHSYWATRPRSAPQQTRNAFDPRFKRERNRICAGDRSVATMFEGLAPYQPAGSQAVLNIREAVNDMNYLLIELQNPGGHALLRNTCSITTLEGSSISMPAEAHAELDCRLLPDQDPEAFMQQLTDIINDRHISIENNGLHPCGQPYRYAAVCRA